jgi:hypothetical protein
MIAAIHCARFSFLSVKARAQSVRLTKFEAVLFFTVIARKTPEPTPIRLVANIKWPPRIARERKYCQMNGCRPDVRAFAGRVLQVLHC